jgi:hypothetical protein
VAAVDDPATVAQDSGATTLDVLANDTDPDGDPKAITKTDGAHGAVAIAHSGADLTYKPDPGYCNTIQGDPKDPFTYELNGGSSATVTVTLTCVHGDCDGTPDRNDDDGDGALDTADAFPLDRAESVGSDGDGIGDTSKLLKALRNRRRVIVLVTATFTGKDNVKLKVERKITVVEPRRNGSRAR